MLREKCNDSRRRAICQWSRSNGRGSSAHPIHSRCRREKNGAACQKSRRMQDEEIGEGEWHVLKRLGGPCIERSPDSVWKGEI
jgi:hypothetical protein